MPTLPRLSDIPDTIALDALWSVLGRLEHEQLDFKRQIGRLTTIIPAMAMTDGGLVVLGISDDRKLYGCDLSQKTLDAIGRAAQDVGVHVQYREVVVDGTPVVIVAVPEVRQRIVTTPDGRLMRRVGSDCVPLLGDAMARFVRERTGQSGEDEVLGNISAEDFDVELINEALAREDRQPVGLSDLSRALIDLDLAQFQPPPADPSTFAAACLLFARRPDRFLPGAVVQIVKRAGLGPGAGPAEERAELVGPLPRLVDQTIDFINEHTRRYQVVVGRHRQILREYPEDVLREAVLNALAHRDYGLQGSTVDITLWDDRIEIHSPGGLPGHITLENIRSEHYSRNRRLMRTLKLLGLVEEYGEGVDRMFSEMEARLMEPPLIAPTSASVTVTLRNRFLVSVEDQAWLALLGHVQLTAAERHTLVLARRDGAVTPRMLRQALPTSDIESLLKGATAKNLLVRSGTAGGTQYVLSDEVIMRVGSSGVEAQSRKRQMLLDEISRRGSLSTVEGALLLGEDQITVRHLLNDLVAAGLSQARGQTRARRYYPAN